MRGGAGYMATCGECGARHCLSLHQAKYYISPDAAGWVWVLICKCGHTCVVDVAPKKYKESNHRRN